MTAGILLSGQARGDWVELSAAGSWTAEYASAIEPQVEAATRGITARGVAININRIEYLDTYGAWLIERTMRQWATEGREARLVGLREDFRGLFEKVHAGTQTLSAPPPSCATRRTGSPIGPASAPTAHRRSKAAKGSSNGGRSAAAIPGTSS